MFKRFNRRAARIKRHKKVRQKIFGTADRPRLCVYRSIKHIYAQIIDDVRGGTLVSISTADPQLKDELSSGGNKEAAKTAGALLAKKALDKGIKEVVFDRNGYKFHGRVAALAEGAKINGLKF
ncbi:MAG: 50S ribosomal protein L18 [Clostridia bacterium]|nr:50S ribosomal protein L18 [Clostridia bacterium]